MPQNTIRNIIPSSYNILNNMMRTELPEILKVLLIDRTRSTPRTTKNIIWATENYLQYGSKAFAPTSQIKPELVTGIMSKIIIPRALKDKELQKERTKSRAEVFTPKWVIKLKNDLIDSNFVNDDLETYIKRKWLEITCGEAPYIATRYDMETGSIIPIKEREGFLDRKLRRINQEIDDKAEWQRLVIEAYQACYGFEWSGDSLLLARENLLYTYNDYYIEKWLQPPIYGLFEDIAKIISYNIFQMDGLNYTIPLSEKKEKIINSQLSLFDDQEEEEQWVIHPGKRVKIMNWDKNRMEFFDKGLKR